MIRSYVFLLGLSAVTGCTRRYASRQGPACPPARAQTRFVEDGSTAGVFSGTVLDRDTGRPLPEARVQVMRTNQFAISDSVGAFSIAGVLPRQHLVSVLRVGYERHTDTVAIRA